MGGCATKLTVLKVEEGEAPEPQEQPLTVSESDTNSKVEEKDEKDEKDEEGDKRTSLGHLFKENEENKVVSENEEITIKETITASHVETKEEKEEEQTKAEVHCADDSEIETEERKFSAPLAEETSYTSQIPAPESPETKENSNEVENVKEVTFESTTLNVEKEEAVVEDNEGDDELEVDSVTEKKEDGDKVPSTTTVA